jgi:hypothetical protein
MSGVINIESYIGKIYNNYQIISFEYFKNYNKSRQPFYKCLCKCDKESIIGLWTLRSLKGKMCNNCKKLLKTLPNGESAINGVFTQYLRHARNRNYEFKISKEKFLEIVNKNCHYCDQVPSNKAKNQNKTGTYIYNGVDRIDNTKGYIENNVVPCCRICNRCKSDMTLDQFKTWIKNVYNKINECKSCE